MQRTNDIVAKAKRLARSSQSWADLSNALFGPVDGLIAKEFPSKADRAAFRKSGDYDVLHKLLEKKIKATGLMEGAEPTKSGRFVVRLPKTLHTALEKEAATEGTSLNQLVVTKLAARLGERL